MKKLIPFIFLLPGLSLAQDSLSKGNFNPPAFAPVVKALETKERMQIDGKLDEVSWLSAPVTDNFFMMEPRQAGQIKHKTWVKVLFDDKNLYFGVFCADSLGKKGVRIQDLRRDFVYGENDVFYLQLDPQNLKRFCVSFQTTPYGNQRELQAFDDTFKDNDWDALWKVRTQITDEGYFAEFAIPFKSLRYEKDNRDSVSWGITLARLARRDYEMTVFPAIPQTFSPYRMTYAAQLTGLKLPKPSLNLRVNPYLLYQNDKVTDAVGNTRIKSTPKLGGEVKWAVNPSSVVDFTFNTDFAQADVDRAVNNLTRFNVFFPERRQFFLENSGIYAGANVDGVNPFFSRTIGLANAQFNATPVSIDAGLRYTSRTQKRTIAGLYVHQRGNETQSGASFGVMRYLQNYGKQNNIGVMLTHRLDEASQEKGLSQRNNTTLSLDGLIRPNDSWTITYLLSASRNNTNDNIGIAGNIYTAFTPQYAYIAWQSKFVDQKYVPGMGFVFANNTIHHNPGGYFIWRPKGKLGQLIRRWDPGFFVNYYQNTNDFSIQESNLYLFPVYIITSTNAQIEYAIYPTWQRYNFVFSILGRDIPLGNYNVIRQMFRYETDASKKISLETKYEFGGYYNGRLNTLTLAGRLAPIPHLALTANYEHNTFSNFGTKKENFRTDLYSVGLRIAPNPRIQLSSFYQYNTLDMRGQWNIRGSWEFAPLSFLYLVFNKSDYRESPIATQAFISKISYMKQF
ncbi:carbohydrate binding family 9 domain-containing protein [Emticicia fontis]